MRDRLTLSTRSAIRRRDAAVGSRVVARSALARPAAAVATADESGPGASGLVRHHWLLVVLVAAGVGLRAATMVAYRPALFFGDSFGYITAAFSGHALGSGSPAMSNYRPSGYPVLLWLLTQPGRDLVQVVFVQHLAGLLVGVLIYAVLVRSGVARWLAAVAAALVLVDGYAIALEQYVMADTFFALTVLAACLLLAWPTLGATRLVQAVRLAGAERCLRGC